MKFSFFTAEKFLCLLHGQVFVMNIPVSMVQTIRNCSTCTDRRYDYYTLHCKNRKNIFHSNKHLTCKGTCISIGHDKINLTFSNRKVVQSNKEPEPIHSTLICLGEDYPLFVMNNSHNTHFRLYQAAHYIWSMCILYENWLICSYVWFIF